MNIGGTNLAITDDGASAVGDAVPVDVTRTKQTVTGQLSVVSNAVVEYDLRTTEGAPVFKAIPEGGVTYTNGCILYLKVSKDPFEPLYHKFNIALKSNDRSISGITIGGTAVTSVGTGASGVSVGTGAGLRGAATINSTAAANGNTVAVTFNDPGARVTGFTVRASNSNPTAANYNNTLESPATSFNLTANITTGQHLSIRVQAENGDIWYHRIVVTVQ